MVEGFLTVDLEDWFHTHNYVDIITKSSWDSQQSRIVDSTHHLMRLLEENSTKATFFVLGWVARKNPSLIKEIERAGHEIASHGYWHDCVYDLTPDEFERDVKLSKEVIEDIIGHEIDGYRAPNFSITEWAIEILNHVGFKYDSSYFPTVFHDRYGKLDGVPFDDRITYSLESGIQEVPLSSLRIGNSPIPWSGGGYFRLLPYRVFRFGVKEIIKQRGMLNFYIHPWEFDMDQPTIVGMKRLNKFRQLNNLRKTSDRFNKLITDFNFGTISSFLSKT